MERDVAVAVHTMKMQPLLERALRHKEIPGTWDVVPYPASMPQEMDWSQFALIYCVAWSGLKLPAGSLCRGCRS
jgi:hypothetical protein